mmetsp:Transcript_117938/g.227411  ORF Transcript_117938/g.227411 Transcript_117938/m.227411 type:complete len:144 (-) Transcript_117938:168-599(-)
MGTAPTCKAQCCEAETTEETVLTREAKSNQQEDLVCPQPVVTTEVEPEEGTVPGFLSGLPVEFVLPGGKVQTIVFKQRPLGMTFANKVPLQVVKIVPGGGADKLGVKVGWEFGKIAGKTLEGLDWKALIDFFQSEANKLPLAV